MLDMSDNAQNAGKYYENVDCIEEVKEVLYENVNKVSEVEYENTSIQNQHCHYENCANMENRDLKTSIDGDYENYDFGGNRIDQNMIDNKNDHPIKMKNLTSQ